MTRSSCKGCSSWLRRLIDLQSFVKRILSVIAVDDSQPTPPGCLPLTAQVDAQNELGVTGERFIEDAALT